MRDDLDGYWSLEKWNLPYHVYELHHLKIALLFIRFQKFCQLIVNQTVV